MEELLDYELINSFWLKIPIHTHWYSAFVARYVKRKTTRKYNKYCTIKMLEQETKRILKTP